MNLRVAVPLFLLSAVPEARAQPPCTNLVTNGGFEDGPDVDAHYFFTYPAMANVIPGWAIGGPGGVDYIGTYWEPSEGKRCMDLNGPNAGTLSTEVPTVVGIVPSLRETWSLTVHCPLTKQLRFYYSGWH